MRSMIYFVTVMIVSAAMFTAACTKPKPKETPVPEQPAGSTVTPQAANTAPKPMQMDGGTAQVVGAEKFWDLHFQRMDILKNYLAKQVDAYKQMGNTPEAAAKVNELRVEQQKEMQGLWEKNGISPREFYPRGNNESVKAERQKFLTDHPELMQKMREMSQEISVLRRELNSLTGKPVPGAPGGNLPPGHPPMNPMPPGHPEMTPPAPESAPAPAPAPAPETAPAPAPTEPAPTEPAPAPGATH